MRDIGCETQASKRPKRQKMEPQEMGSDDITQGKRRKVVLPKRFEVGMAPVVVVKAEAEAPSRAAYRQGRRFKERCFDTDEARRKRTETSDSRRKERRGELKKKKRLDDAPPLYQPDISVIYQRPTDNALSALYQG